MLASDEFVRDHCFEIASGTRDDPTLLGVRFSPAPKRRTPDISGVLWVDSTNAELDREFEGGCVLLEIGDHFVARRVTVGVTGERKAGEAVVAPRCE